MKKYKDEEYDICKEACINHGCYLPPSHEFHRARANIPMYIRAYYYLKGWTDCKKRWIDKFSEFACLKNDQWFKDWLKEDDSESIEVGSGR